MKYGNILYTKIVLIGFLDLSKFSFLPFFNILIKKINAFNILVENPLYSNLNRRKPPNWYCILLSSLYNIYICIQINSQISLRSWYMYSRYRVGCWGMEIGIENELDPHKSFQSVLCNTEMQNNQVIMLRYSSYHMF